MAFVLSGRSGGSGGGGAPSGPAGGDLGGTYPNPTVVGADIAFGETILTSGNLTNQSSASFADITGASVTITTGARRVRVSCIVIYEGQQLQQSVYTDIAVDGTRVGGTDGLSRCVTYDSSRITVALSYVTGVLTAGSHTFKLQYKVSASNTTIFASTASPLVIQAAETLFTT